ncbi:uncharacterized protein LOC18424270 isoform X2 [Amborella trichopoda]|uniref:uncharacterized protein LOC18424270 isoform X2 n=1 Tax=Amborella trichopoda TaxID=13333 RepID=UPI0009C10AA8|nr:uncharacterized protein LOC18424270 isoform X2 [Amborella trichopoda]|eukprot:XP_020517125.1 uncharacterized protein LOC18424270 isoform X2 [Amborella trichopoda]
MPKKLLENSPSTHHSKQRERERQSRSNGGTTSSNVLRWSGQGVFCLSPHETNGAGLNEAANNWAFDTSQFDGILKILRVQVADSEGKETSSLQIDDQTPSKEGTIFKSTRPQGRYKERERGKLVNLYSAKDLQDSFGNKLDAITPSNVNEVEDLTAAVEFHISDHEGTAAEAI